MTAISSGSVTIQIDLEQVYTVSTDGECYVDINGTAESYRLITPSNSRKFGNFAQQTSITIRVISGTTNYDFITIGNAVVLNDSSGNVRSILNQDGKVASPIINVGVGLPPPDGIDLYGAAITITSALVADVAHSSNPFKQTDINKLLCFWEKVQVGGINRYGVIQNVTTDGNKAQVLFNSSINTPVSNATLIYGSDYTPLMSAALAEAKAKKCSIQLAYGIYTFGNRFTVPQGVDIIGKGRNKAIGSSKEFIYSGTTLALLANVSGINNNFILLSDAGGTQSRPQAGLYDLNVDGMFNVFFTVDATGGYGNEIERVSILRPALVNDSACINVGLSTRLYNSFMDGHSAGQCVRAQQVADFKVKNNWLASSRTGFYNAKLAGCTDGTFSGNHSFKNGTTPGLGGQVLIQSFASAHTNIIEVIDNIFDTSGGPHVRVQTSGGANLRDVVIKRNQCFQNDAIPSGIYNAFEVNIGSGSVVNGVEISDNSGTSSWANVANAGYLALLDYQNSGTVYLDKFTNNTFSNVASVFTGNRLPEVRGGNVIRVGTTATILKSSSTGRFIGEGDGSTVTFTFAHGLGGIPGSLIVTAGSAAAAGIFYSTADNINITVTYSVAPVSGTANVLLNWNAAI